MSSVSSALKHFCRDGLIGIWFLFEAAQRSALFCLVYLYSYYKVMKIGHMHQNFIHCFRRLCVHIPTNYLLATEYCSLQRTVNYAYYIFSRGSLRQNCFGV